VLEWFLIMKTKAIGYVRVSTDKQNGGKSLRKIADQLNRLKIRTRQGSRWRHEYVARLLKAA
jgi:DNA invertase Pin-like site-specific DNA recombinase